MSAQDFQNFINEDMINLGIHFAIHFVGDRGVGRRVCLLKKTNLNLIFTF